MSTIVTIYPTEEPKVVTRVLLRETAHLVEDSLTLHIGEVVSYDISGSRFVTVWEENIK